MAPKKDFTQIAFAVVQQATGEFEPPVKDEAAVSAGRKGGTARKSKLSEADRKRIAQAAANARWKK
jgi:hypothetical protein